MTGSWYVSFYTPILRKKCPIICSSGSTLIFFSNKRGQAITCKTLPVFFAVLFTMAKIWKQPPKCPLIDEWIKKSCDMYNGIWLSHEKELIICNNMDGPRSYYAKWNKSGGERQVPYNFTLCEIE